MGWNHQEECQDCMSNVNHEDMTEEVVQTPQVNQPVVAPLTPMTLLYGSAQGTSTQIIAQATPTSTPREQQTPSSSSTSTDPVKTRSLCEIYEVGIPNSFSLFALFSQIEPLTFEVLC